MAKYYHVITQPLDECSSVAEAIELYSNGLYPRIPMSAGYNEDKTIPRVCLAPRVEQCITAIGFNIGPNRYKPIVILEFDLEDWEVYCPTVEQLPDVEDTGEVWSLCHIKPTAVYEKWLGQGSIVRKVHKHKDGTPFVECIRLEYLSREDVMIMEEQDRAECQRMAEHFEKKFSALKLD